MPRRPVSKSSTRAKRPAAPAAVASSAAPASSCKRARQPRVSTGFTPRAKFADLPPATRKRIAATIIGGMRRLGYFARGGYKTVHGPDQANRPRISAETAGEVGQLTIDERNRLIALARNAARNSERLEGILRQVAVNVIGPDGGKAVFEFPTEFKDAENAIRRAFANWSEEAEYFEDQSLQTTLRLALRTQMLGGEVVLVFDDGLTAESTGQIISFEPDCIGDLDEFDALYPNYSQFQGIVKNANGKTVGVTVSWAQRGQSVYARTIGGKLAAWTLIKTPGTKWRDSPFTIYRDAGRFNQIRGSSALWPGLGTVADLSDLQGFEVQAAKHGAQKIAQITQEEDDAGNNLDAQLDPDAQAPIDAPDYETAAQAAQEAAEEAKQTELDVEAINGAGVIYDVLPPGVKMELLDTKHPNDKLVEFSNWLHRGVGFSLGLGAIHTTGKADSSYSASQAEMVLSQLSFDDEAKRLERGVLDWALTNWSRWAQRRGLIPQDSELPEDWRRTCVKWSRPPHRSLDPVKEQTALNSGLKNGTILYREKWGPDWREKALAFGEEIEFFRAHGIPHLALQTVSGGVVETDPNPNPEESEE